MKKEKKPKILLSLKTLFISIVFIWLIFTVLIWLFFKDWNLSGPFGDSFGAINSLFSGLALAGVIFTIYLQKKELQLQRQELKYTREELKRTANAQEFSSNLLKEQIRINNIPFLEFETTVTGEDYFLYIKNQSKNPAFDIDVWIIKTILNSSYPLSDFLDTYVIEDTFIDIDESHLIDGDLYCLCERAIFYSFPQKKKIKFHIDFPLKENNTFYIFIQYRDSLGNNYSQQSFFAHPHLKPDEFKQVSVTPTVPEIAPRLGWIDEKKNDNYPDFLNSLIDLKNVSIFVSQLKNKNYYGVENVGEMIDI